MNGLFATRFIRAPGRTLIAIFLSCACAAHAAADIPDTTLVYCSEASPAGFDDAQYATSVEATAAAYTVHDRLVEFRLDGSGVNPGLAQSWDISPDGLQYTFHLCHGVKFQTTAYFKPTRDFDADDVLFTFMRMLDPEQPFHQAYPVVFPYFRDLGLAKNITRIEALDPYTVRFTLASVDAPFMQKIAMPFASILSREYADSLLASGNARDINQYPVGTGPFVFRSYVKDATISFDANPDYWRADAVRVRRLVFQITVDPAVRLQKLRTGECQLMSYPRLADIAYNTSKKPFDDPAVRRALDMSIDKHAIIESVYQGAGQRATNPMPPTQWAYDASLKDAPFDPARAKAMLADAGYPDGIDLDLWAMPVQRPYNPNAKLMAEMIQADWAKIGVRAHIVTYECGEYIRRARAGEHDALLIGWTGDYGDPDDWLGVLLGCDAVKGSNFAKWCYKPFDDLVKQARATVDVRARTTQYLQAQRIFKEQVPFTPIAHSTVYQPLARGVEGFTIDPYGPTLFWGVSLK
ncbi:Dipeptide-binding ABC transporter, periplasmic substrate-binding component [Candidatus Burkholderia verschuerenii]|uniref:Dipeptide-binding ABC transporter, periplasmic substrate-binding component n=1 Tax=Candidatus Burkholderia verschuerenii TaxID=242163 RepID=A0A0L0MFZ0_9BURK|nr:ABC transporter substrate-binding protein [Candidatus Burkholderia verschuerenii]KND61200.1 Dipeptide-binding ABC transporter, periplasmic substrate-binding component [Candidatus Burkholderia verschuerenii]